MYQVNIFLQWRSQMYICTIFLPQQFDFSPWYVNNNCCSMKFKHILSTTTCKMCSKCSSCNKNVTYVVTSWWINARFVELLLMSSALFLRMSSMHYFCTFSFFDTFLTFISWVYALSYSAGKIANISINIEACSTVIIKFIM